MVPAWVRVGLVAGAIAFVVTLLANLLILILQPADLCRFGPGIIPLSFLAALAAFVVLAAVAGFLTGRATGDVSEAALTGLLVGAISGCALLALVAFQPAISHRTEALSARCPDTSIFTSGGSFSFGFGTPPPGFIPPTPPGVFPTPPPGFFATPPPGFASPPAGPVGIVLEAVGLIVTLTFGTALATGVASLSGLIGASMRRNPA